MDKEMLGIHKNDPRFSNDFAEFAKKYDEGTLEVNNWSEITAAITDIYNVTKTLNNGKVADYIPQLAKADGNAYGIVAVSVDGQVFQIGDNPHSFCMQSCSKPITYCMALEEHGENVVHNFIGKEPSGRNFNELCLNEDGLPHNPLINSGAIMATSLIKKEYDQATRFDYAFDYWKRLISNNFYSFNNSVYLSEKDTADRNYCLGYMMQEQKTFECGKNKSISETINRKWDGNDLVKNLELYFQFCSIETDLLGAGLIAATLANGGVNPWTNDKIFTNTNVKKVLTMMLSCGMYDYSGEWSYSIGIPAKSGVSGLIFAIISGVMGIAVYSPKLDKCGNSFRGVEFFKMFSDKINVHLLENHYITNKIPIRHKDTLDKKLLGYLLLDSALNNNLITIREVLARGCDINFSDYDKRTAMHIAVAEKNVNVIRFLIDNNADITKKDRWNCSPEDGINDDDTLRNLFANENSSTTNVVRNAFSDTNSLLSNSTGINSNYDVNDNDTN